MTRRRRRYNRISRREIRRKQVMQRRLVLIGSILVIALVIWGISFLSVRNKVNKAGTDIIYQNIFVEDVDLSGMTEEDALAALDNKVQEQGKKKVTLKLENEEMQVSLADMGIHIEEVEALVKEAMAYGKSGSVWKRNSQLKKLQKEKVVFEAEYAIDEGLSKTVLEKKMENVDKGTVDATIKRENGKFIVTDEQRGITVDMEASHNALTLFFTGDWEHKEAVIQLVSKVDEPKVTREDLEQIEDLLGSYTTHCGVGGGRVQNIETGAAKMDGTLLLPGEEFSADAMMRPYTKENGYEEAGSYLNGKVVQSMGGGICQVSSTLYNAVILAELEVTQRQPHSMLVSYVEPAMDAAIAGDWKDLKFENNLDVPIYIEAYVRNGNITFNIYGKETRAKNRRIEYVSETIETKKAEPEFEASNDSLGKIEQIDSEHVGMTAKLWKVVYEDGKEVERTVVNTSKYSSSPAVYSVGTSSDYAEASAIVKAAIKTQKRKKIDEAIAEAKALIREKRKAEKEEQKNQEPDEPAKEPEGTEETTE